MTHTHISTEKSYICS